MSISQFRARATRFSVPRLVAGVALAALLLAVPLSAQGTATEEDVDEAVARISRVMSRSTPDTIWDEVLRLRELGSHALEAIEDIYDDQPAVVQLGLAAALGELNEVEGCIDRAFGLLQNKETDTEVRRLAAQLIDRYGLFIEDREFQTTVGARLEDFLDDPFNPLALKVAVSQALYDATGNPRGRKNLQEYLKSDQIGVRNTAALALAELGQYVNPAVKDVLRSFQDEPGSRGRLARTFLDLDYYQRQVDLAEAKPRTVGGDPKDDGRWRLLTEIEEKIKLYHIYGDTDLAQHERLLARAAKGLVNAMDRHSTWYTAKDFKAFMEDLNRDYGGIGAYVGFRGEPPVFTILRPIYSGPAYKAGLRSRDVIWEVDGWPTDGKKIDEIIRRLKGKPGSEVNLTIFRPGWKKERKIPVSRGRISIASCQGTLLPGDIGYITMSTFSDDTSEELVRLLSTWRRAGTLKGVILDLRNNGGGYLDTAREVADQFLPKGTLIVYSEGRNAQVAPRQELKAKVKERFPDLPMVCLINGSSASASEIVCGALKVHKRATVIGLRSFGKGSVQKPIPLETDPNGRLRLTIARYHLPDGHSIHREIDADGAVIKGQEGGIDPDIIVEQDTALDIRDAEELARLELAGVHRDYVDKHLDAKSKESRAQFEGLVLWGEGKDRSWPEFDAYYSSLETSATEKSVKRMLRLRAREVMQDLNGAEYLPLSPIDEDEQLQVALEHLCRAAETNSDNLAGLEMVKGKYDEVLAEQETLRKRYSR